MIWSLRHFDKPTPYTDEPNEFIAPGYYVLGHDEDEDEETPRVVLKVEEAVDAEGRDARDGIAHQIIDVLNAAPTLVG